MSEKFGKIAQVIGPVVDVAFDLEQGGIPPIYTALKVTRPSGDLILEVEQHIGIQLNKRLGKALKYLDEFSHILVIFINKTNRYI